MSPVLALSGGSQGGKFTSAFGEVAEVHGPTASAAFDANDPKETRNFWIFAALTFTLRVTRNKGVAFFENKVRESTAQL
jgi:hypothetical protein